MKYCIWGAKAVRGWAPSAVGSSEILSDIEAQSGFCDSGRKEGALEHEQPSRIAG